jgi:hypothetical protein
VKLTRKIIHFFCTVHTRLRRIPVVYVWRHQRPAAYRTIQHVTRSCLSADPTRQMLQPAARCLPMSRWCGRACSTSRRFAVVGRGSVRHYLAASGRVDPASEQQCGLCHGVCAVDRGDDLESRHLVFCIGMSSTMVALMVSFCHMKET